MGYKTISLSDEAYKKLASLKRGRESFSEVVLRLYSKAPKKALASFAGGWDMTDEEAERVFGEIAELWGKYEESLLGHRLFSSVAEKKS